MAQANGHPKGCPFPFAWYTASGSYGKTEVNKGLEAVANEYSAGAVTITGSFTAYSNLKYVSEGTVTVPTYDATNTRFENVELTDGAGNTKAYVPGASDHEKSFTAAKAFGVAYAQIQISSVDAQVLATAGAKTITITIQKKAPATAILNQAKVLGVASVSEDVVTAPSSWDHADLVYTLTINSDGTYGLTDSSSAPVSETGANSGIWQIPFKYGAAPRYTTEQADETSDHVNDAIEIAINLG